jgi:hypothetical protein
MKTKTKTISGLLFMICIAIGSVMASSNEDYEVGLFKNKSRIDRNNKTVLIRGVLFNGYSQEDEVYVRVVRRPSEGILFVFIDSNWREVETCKFLNAEIAIYDHASFVVSRVYRGNPESGSAIEKCDFQFKIEKDGGLALNYSYKMKSKYLLFFSKEQTDRGDVYFDLAKPKGS